jgi:hypothetical protein
MTSSIEAELAIIGAKTLGFDKNNTPVYKGVLYFSL